MPARRLLLWAVLALPAMVMLAGLASGRTVPMDLYHPTGEWSLRLMILALMAGPLSEFFPGNRFVRAWLSARRNLGVAAFGYGLLHLLAYALDMGGIAAMLDEFLLPAIWTGWLALALMAAAAAISRDAAMRTLGRMWKRIQQGVYAALLLALLHWALLDRNPGPALVHLAPLIIVWMLRGIARFRRVPPSKG